jgi:biotin synthase
MSTDNLRHDFSRAEVLALFDLPFNDLLARAHAVHAAHHDPNAVQVSTLLSIKTGGCPEDCAYCPQAARYHTGVEAQKLMPLDAVLDKARQAKAAGATRFCMGAAWRSPKDRDVEKVAAMIREVKALGMETVSRPRAWTTTTTISTRRRSSTARSSTRANSTIAWTRSNACATRA